MWVVLCAAQQGACAKLLQRIMVVNKTPNTIGGHDILCHYWNKVTEAPSKRRKCAMVGKVSPRGNLQSTMVPLFRKCTTHKQLADSWNEHTPRSHENTISRGLWKQVPCKRSISIWHLKHICFEHFSSPLEKWARHAIQKGVFCRDEHHAAEIEARSIVYTIDTLGFINKQTW